MFPDHWGSDYDYEEAHGNYDEDRPRLRPRSARDAALLRLEADPNPLVRHFADLMRKVGGGPSAGAVCRHEIDLSAGCGRCLASGTAPVAKRIV